MSKLGLSHVSVAKRYSLRLIQNVESLISNQGYNSCLPHSHNLRLGTCLTSTGTTKSKCTHSTWAWSHKKVFLKQNSPWTFEKMRGFKSQASQKNENGKIALWKRMAVVAAVGGVVAYGYHSINREREIRDEQIRYEEFKKAELGGDWTLTDHHGKERSSTEFRGQWVLMYFGFTHCPDICPEELEKLVSIVEYFDDNTKLPSMMPIFVTLDPERDTPGAIKDYLAEYKCPRLLGFTASSESTIREVATRYRAYFSKGPPDEDNDYIVDHTIIIYLINPKGEFVNYFDRSRTADKIINTVTDHIHKFNEMEGKVK